MLAGLVAARVALDAKVVIDRDADWREVCLGCRRSGGSGDALAVSRLALVHLHGLSGRAGTLELTLSAPGSPVALDVARSPDEAPLIQTKLGESPQPIRSALAPGQRDVDVWLRASSAHGLPMLLHRLVLEREARAMDRVLQILPLGVGLAVLFLLARRQPLGIALVFALASLAAAVLAVQVLHDPVALLELKAGPRQRAQIGLAALVAVAALWRPPGRLLAFASLALAGALLYLPTAGHGLVSDDFLWAREWSVADVASTFVGPEDPSGESNLYYRPLSALSHATDAWIWGDRVAGYHVHEPRRCSRWWAPPPCCSWRGLGLSRRAALLGALAWIVHPMAASAVAWASQRTDLIVSLFYLSTLAVLLSPLGARGWPALLPALLALGSKEIAISLPAMATLVVWLVLPAEERRPRLRALGALWGLALVYLAWWVWLFPDKATAKLFAEAPRAGRAPASGARPRPRRHLHPGLRAPRLRTLVEPGRSRGSGARHRPGRGGGPPARGLALPPQRGAPALGGGRLVRRLAGSRVPAPVRPRPRGRLSARARCPPSPSRVAAAAAGHALEKRRRTAAPRRRSSSSWCGWLRSRWPPPTPGVRAASTTRCRSA